MIILGVDPGTRITGFGLIRVAGNRYEVIDFGCIRPKAAARASERYRMIHEGIVELIGKYAPEALAIETQYIDKNPQSGIKLGMARGVVSLAASLHQIPVFEYPPTVAKRAVVGTGSASKYQVGGMVKSLLNLAELPTPEDAADALALAICHAHAAHNRWHQKHQV